MPQFEIIRVIIRLIPIEMMDFLDSKKWTTQLPSHYHAVLQCPACWCTYPNVAIRIDPTIRASPTGSEVLRSAPQQLPSKS